MISNFVDVYRHFGPNAEKVLLGKLGLSSDKEYFLNTMRIMSPLVLILRLAS